MAISKRIKITFSNPDDNQYTAIDKGAIVEAQKTISSAMKCVIREYQKNAVNSKQLASKVALNS